MVPKGAMVYSIDTNYFKDVQSCSIVLTVYLYKEFNLNFLEDG